MLNISNAYITNNAPISVVYSQINNKSVSLSTENNHTNNNVRSKNLLDNSDMLSLFASQASVSTSTSISTASASSTSSTSSSLNSLMSLSPKNTNQMISQEKNNKNYLSSCQTRSTVTRIDEHPQTNSIKDDNIINNKIKKLNIDNTLYKDTTVKNNENNLNSNDSAVFSLSNNAKNEILSNSREKFRSRRQTIHSKVKFN